MKREDFNPYGDGAANLDAATILQLKQRAKDDLYFLAKAILGFKDITPEIHLPLCRMLQNRAIRRKRAKLPRSWLKSTICTIAYPIWLAINNPEVRILVVQNTYTNACGALSTIGQIFLGNELFRALFPEILPDETCTWKSDKLCVKRKSAHKEGTFDAAGVNTQVVSRHYDHIIEDDTVAPRKDEMGKENILPTKEHVEQAIGFHKLIMPLFNDPAKSESLVVGTRWYEEDLLSWIEANQPEYVGYERAVREDEDGRPSPTGKIVWPERFGEKVLAELEAAVGPYMYACLYLNSPMKSKDMVFKPDWFEFYKLETLPDDLVCYTTVDLATDPKTAKGKDIDYNVVITCGKPRRPGPVYGLELTRERCSPGETIATIFRHARKYRPVKVGIEAVQYQTALDFFIKQEMQLQEFYFNIVLIRHKNHSKAARIMALQPVFAAGGIVLPPTMQVLVNEALAFPRGKHDDTIDALSMQLQMWGITSRLRGSRASNQPDPFSLEAAEEELRRRRSNSIPQNMDVLRLRRPYSRT